MQASGHSWRSLTLSVLLASVPLMLSIDGRWKALVPATLFAVGVFLVITQPATRQSYRAAWPVVGAVALFAAGVLWDVALHHQGWRPVDRAAHLVLYLAIAAVFAYRLRLAVLWSGFAACALILGGACIVQHHVQGIARAYGWNGGPSASIELATVLLGLVLLALARLLGAPSGRVERGLLAAAVVCGLYGALLTQSRGPLLAFAPALLLVLGWHARRTRRWRFAALLLVGIGAGVVIVAQTTHEELAGRFAAIAPAVASYDDQRDVRGPVRERLEMWRVAVQAVREHPWTGIGTGGFHAYVAGEVAARRASPVIARYNQPHNQYLEAAAAAGVPGLAILLATFLLPLRYFLRRLRDDDEVVRVAAAAGAAIVVLYAFCGLTDSVFYRVMPLSLYFFVVPGMALLVGVRRSRPLGTAD